MRTISLRATARRTALAATIAAMPASVLVASASAAPTLTEVRLEAAAVQGTSSVTPRRVEQKEQLRERDDVQRHVQLREKRQKAERAERKAAQAAASRGEQVLELASHEAGDPYVYGAAGPSSFDCSGFTQYVFAQLGISLPHSSSAQASMAERVTDPQAGDLVFFSDGGGVYHVAIYAGDGMIWHAPHSGSVVRLEAIWTSSVFYGRVL